MSVFISSRKNEVRIFKTTWLGGCCRDNRQLNDYLLRPSCGGRRRMLRPVICHIKHKMQTHMLLLISEDGKTDKAEEDSCSVLWLTHWRRRHALKTFIVSFYDGVRFPFLCFHFELHGGAAVGTGASLQEGPGPSVCMFPPGTAFAFGRSGELAIPSFL